MKRFPRLTKLESRAWWITLAYGLFATLWIYYTI